MWFGIGIKDVIDILLVAYLSYHVYRLIRGTTAVNIFIGIITLIICWYLVSKVFEMQLLGSILNKVMEVGTFALVIIFQKEIRRFFSFVGMRQKWAILQWIYKLFESKEKKIEDATIESIVGACKDLSKSRFGAIIVIAHHSDLYEYSQSGEFIDANANTRLIENIFFKNSPLHDGAIIISEKRIIAAGCILPISRNQELPKQLGLRHRAALGISERTDATAVVVSEETGKISVAKGGQLTLNVTPIQLESLLSARVVDKNISDEDEKISKI